MNTHVQIHPESTQWSADSTAEAGGVDIDLRQLWSVVYRNRLLIIVIVGLALLGGAIVTMLATPIFSAFSSIQVEQQTDKVLASDDVAAAMSAQESDRFLQTQIDIIKSRALADRVANSLNLDRTDDFLVKMTGKQSASASTVAVTPAMRGERVAKMLRDNLAVSLPRNSRIVSIGFSSPDARLATQVANSYAQNIITANLQRRYDASAYARGFLENQLRLAKQRLEDSERATIAYARSAGLLDTSAGIAPGAANEQTTGVRSLTVSNLVQFNNAFIQAQAARVAAQQRWQQTAGAALLSLPEVQSNPAIQQLSQQRAIAQANYEQERERHKPDFPTMKQAAAQLAALDGQIRQIATRLRDGIRDQYEIARRQEDSFRAKVGDLRGTTLTEQDRSVQYNILKRESDTNRSMYDGLLQRYKEVSAGAGVSSNNISLLDQADVPDRPISPRPAMNLAVAGVIGLALAVLVILGRERFDDAIRSPDDVERKLGVPFLNSIPLVPVDRSPIEALADPRSSLAEAYFALRTSLRLVSPAGMPRSMLFTSSREGEGKSTTTYAIARDFAQIGMRVLMIDADLRRPSLHRLTGGLNDVGLTNVLAQQMTLQSALKATDTPGLSFLSAGPIPPSPAELLSGPVLARLIQEARSIYDLIVIDGPPVLGLADAVLLSATVEATVFVVEAGRPNHGHAKAALRRFSGSGARVLGAVLTKFDPRHTGYGNEYGYYYSYGKAETARDAA